jgi:hypothetical protein
LARAGLPVGLQLMGNYFKRQNCCRPAHAFQQATDWHLPRRRAFEMSTVKKEASLLVQGYEVVIGFETHAQLATQSKIFSRAPTAFGAEPNTQACAVDLALPGTLPVMNREAVAHAIRLGLALGSHIAEQSVFARKNYFYPDLPKGYQISQFEIPVVQGGEVASSSATRRRPCAWCAPTWKKTRARACTRTSSASRASTSTAPARRCWRS